MIIHPCQKCGACCAYFRVSLHWSETLLESHAVPFELTEKVSPHTSAMIGTNQKNPRCSSVVGTIGKKVSCNIYENRPESCRTFSPSFEDGSRNERCEKARLSKGMLVLNKSNWV